MITLKYDSFVLGALLHDMGKFLVRLRPKVNRDALQEDYPGVNVKNFAHALHSETFLKDNHHLFSEPGEVSRLSVYHHTTKREGPEKFVQIADSLSSSERSKMSAEYEEEYSKAAGMPYGDISTPLFSVFAQVETTQERLFRGDRYDLAPLDIWDHSAFPKKDIMKLERAYHRLKEQMEQDVLEPGTWRLPDLNFEDDIVTIYHILYRYTWCMASATFEQKRRYYPDISLLDHSITTAAIASCLYGLDEGEVIDKDKEFVVLKGDVSGIQNFVYGIAQPQSVKGVSKRLRGRSFHVIVMAEAAARYILRAAGLKIVNLLHCGGGEFEILLPNERATIDAVDEAIAEIEAGLFQQLHGELGMTFAREDFSRDEFKKFGLILDRINDRISIAKGEKYRGLIDSGMEDFTMPPEDKIGNPTYCRSCVVELVEDPGDAADEASVCELCRDQRNIGGLLPKAKFVVFADAELEKPGSNMDIISVPLPTRWGSVWLVRDKALLKQFLHLNADTAGAAEVYRINSTDDFILNLDMNNETMKGKPLKVSYGFWFLANSAPVAEEVFPHTDDTEVKYEVGDVLDFADIANMSIGDSRLGILRMDVDRAGLIFSVGLDRGQDDTDKSISRIATMSRMLNLFFCGRLNAICESVSSDWRDRAGHEAPEMFQYYKDKISDNIFYTVYAGGDDLFIVGPWSEIPHLAQRINQEFRDFTSGNPNITISGGAFLCKPKFPINRFAQLTHEELTRSKEHGGNTMTIFGESATWDGNDVETGLCKLIEFGENLYKAAAAEHPDKLARAFLNNLIRLRQQFVRNSEIDHNFIPAIIYQISRNVSARARIEIDGMDTELWTYLKHELISSTDSWSTFKKVRIPATYALLKLRDSR